MLDLAQWKPDDLLKAIALLGAGLAFLVGLSQYRRAQQWKRAEWVAQEMKGLFVDPMARAALFMIDWGSRRVELYPSRENESERFVLTTDDLVARALMWHGDRPQGFSDEEAAIRNAFDTFLDGIERFNAYEVSGLVTLTDVRPYLAYWADKICREPKQDGTEDRLIRLRAYLERYGFDGARRLLGKVAAERIAT
jgi:hypothetical protein